MRGTATAAPDGDIIATGNMGESSPVQTDGGGHVQFGPQLNVISETYMVSESSGQPPSKEGGAQIPPATSVNPEAPDTLMEALQSAIIVEGGQKGSVRQKQIE